MGFVGMVATLTSINSGIQMSTHVLHSMARDGFIHKVVLKEKRGVEYVSLTISAGIIIFISFFNEIEFITQVSNFIFLFSMFFLCISVITIRRKRPNLIRPWKVPLFPITPFIGAVAAVILVFSIPGSAFIAGVFIVLLGITYYLLQLVRRDRVLLLIHGFKVGVSLILIIIIAVFDMESQWGLIHWIEDLILVIAIFSGLSLAVDLYPVRSIITAIARQNEDAVVVGGISNLSLKQERTAGLINFLISRIFFAFALIFVVVFALSTSGTIYLVNSNPEVHFNSVDFRLILSVIFGTVSIVYFISGLVPLLQELEVRKMKLLRPKDEA